MKLKNNIALLCLLSLLTQNMFGSDPSQALAAGAAEFSVVSLVTAGVASSRAGRANRRADESTNRVASLEGRPQVGSSGVSAATLAALQVQVTGLAAGQEANGKTLAALQAQVAQNTVLLKSEAHKLAGQISKQAGSSDDGGDDGSNDDGGYPDYLLPDSYYPDWFPD